MTDASVKTPWHIWLVGLIAVLFNSIGVFDFVMSMAQGADYQASAGMTPDQIAHYQQMPSWMTVVWAVGVFGAFLASILLLLRRRPAWLVFILSLVAFVVSLLYTYILSNGGAVMGQQMAITSTIIAGLLAFFSWYFWLMALRGVLR
jgi:beta-lactamase regulating signal transducer with metallopeptidase domain